MGWCPRICCPRRGRYYQNSPPPTPDKKELDCDETVHYQGRDDAVVTYRECARDDGSAATSERRVFRTLDQLRRGDPPPRRPWSRSLTFLLETQSWGGPLGPRTLAECFDARIVDDGVVALEEFSDVAAPDTPLYYWSARFGGNVLGFVLRCGGNGVFAAWSDTWLVVLANVDDDWRWRGFIARTRALLEKH